MTMKRPRRCNSCPTSTVTTMLLFPIALLLFLVLVAPTSAATTRRRRRQHRQLQGNDNNLGHLQSGPDEKGSSFASSAVLDSATQTLHIVGNTFGTWWSLHDQIAGIVNTTTTTTNANDASSGNTHDAACFYAVAQLPSANPLSSSGLSWIHSELLGRTNVEEACFGLLLDASDKYRKFITGHSQPSTNALLGPLFNRGVLGAEDVTQMGVVLDYKLLQRSSSYVDDALLLHGGRVEQQYHVTYPVAIAADNNGDNNAAAAITKLYVASMLTDDSQRNNLYDPDQDLDPSQYLTYGSQYRMKIREFTKLPEEDKNPLDNPLGDDNSNTDAQLVRSLVPGRTKEYATLLGQSVAISGMIYTGDGLVVAGTTDGLGVGFSVDKAQMGDAGNSRDGFVTQLDLLTLTPKNDSTVTTPLYRIASGGGDDVVTGLCYSNGSIFVVGHSNGFVASGQVFNPDDVSMIRAFVLKLSLADMSQPVWTLELGARAAPGTDNDPATTVARAISCAVNHDGTSVYVAGEVENGAIMEHSTQSFGGTDVWVAEIGAQDGSDLNGQVIFLEQLGSSADDTVAGRGGLQVDANNGPVLIANTRGEVYRHRDSDIKPGLADVFIARFEPGTGAVDHPVEHEDFVSLAPLASRPPIPAPPTTSPTLPLPTAVPTVAPIAAPTNDDGSSGSLVYKVFERWVEVLVIILIISFLVTFFSWYYNLHYLPKRDVPTDRKRVLNYLHDFDVEDVDLKRSATGGWSCTYVGDLANGVNNQEPGTSTMGLGALRYRDRDPLNYQETGRAARRTSGTSTRFEDEFLLEDGENAAAAGAFGTNRKNRSEKSGIGAKMKNAYHEYHKFAGGDSSEKQHHSNVNLHTGTSSFDDADDDGGLRVNKAKKRWQNREII